MRSAQVRRANESEYTTKVCNSRTKVVMAEEVISTTSEWPQSRFGSNAFLVETAGHMVPGAILRGFQVACQPRGRTVRLMVARHGGAKFHHTSDFVWWVLNFIGGNDREGGLTVHVLKKKKRTRRDVSNLTLLGDPPVWWGRGR